MQEKLTFFAASLEDKWTKSFDSWLIRFLKYYYFYKP